MGEMYESIFLALSLIILLEDFGPELGGERGEYQNGLTEGEICMTGKIPDVPDGVVYDGQCRDLYEDGICALGERLFLKDGNVECDCDEGWLRNEGRCYQEFTPAFCGENEVLNLGTKRRLREGQTYTCVLNPCDANQLAHRETWA